MVNFAEDVFKHIGEQIIAFSPKLLASIIIFLAFYLIAFVLARIVRGLARKAESDKARVYNLFVSVLKAVIIVVGIITALGTLGIDVTAMVAGLGLSGFALGFALKDAISNLLSGVLILFYHPFRCGDKIKVSGCEGVVKDINLRYTVLQGEGLEFLVPNSICFTNWLAVKRGDMHIRS